MHFGCSDLLYLLAHLLEQLLILVDRNVLDQLETS